MPSRCTEPAGDHIVFSRQRPAGVRQVTVPHRSHHSAARELQRAVPYCAGEAATARAAGDFVVLEFRSEDGALPSE